METGKTQGSREEGAGFYGKLTSHGDFVSRRLPPAFIGPWDAWLQASMTESRQQLGAAWLDSYLNSPIWRFMLGPGLCGEQAWAGVLMPSVDRVGRHFPLTIALPFSEPAALCNRLLHGTAWFECLEDLALQTLVPGFAFEQFDAALTRIRLPERTSDQVNQMDVGAPDAMQDAAIESDLIDAPQIPAELSQWDGLGSVWWIDPVPTGSPAIQAFARLPEPARFHVLLQAGATGMAWP